MKVTRASDGSPRFNGYQVGELMDSVERRDGNASLLLLAGLARYLAAEAEDLRKRVEELERRS